MKQTNQIPGLYDPSFEHDNCGIGACVNIKGVKNHQTVDNALKIVETLEHRAGKDAAGETGDGVGIMLQISHKFFSKACKAANINIGKEREYGIGMFFFPNDELRLRQAKKMFEIIVEKEGMTFLGWREVPTTPTVLGKKALECMPKILQGFVAKPVDVEKGLDFDRKLYIARKVFEQSNEESYVVSLSSRTIVYKGMFLVGQLRTFFNDLQDPDYESAIALVHSRFSTNTTPSWEKAHPYRFIVHNGEINTIRGNADKMLAREENMESEYLKNEMHKLIPVVNPNGSDSARLDNTLEFLVMSGMDLPHAIMITIPEPWENNKVISQEKRDFYQYYATMMEPWDGPASIIFTDGDQVGAVLDRNGLRPSRYYITDDDQLILSSEIGVLDIDPTKIVVKERLHPGKMLLVDTIKGEVIADDVVKEKYAEKEPYGEWLDSNLLELKDLKIPNVPVPAPEELVNEVKNEIAAAEGRKESDYTEETWKVYEKALNAAKEAVEQKTATEEEMQQILTALRNAASALKKETPSTEKETPSTEKETPSTNPQTPETPNDGTVKVGQVIKAEGQYGVFTYKVTGKDTVEVKSITAKGKAKKSVKIFDKIKASGKTWKVTGVAANALKGNKKMESLTIGKNVKKIGKNAFANCRKLKKVTVKSKKINTIGKNAFKNINKKATVKVPKAQKKKYAKLLNKAKLSKKVKIK